MSWGTLMAKDRNIDDKVNWEEMDRTRKRLNMETGDDWKHNEIYCGYLRQPITQYNQDGKLIVEGRCVLFEKYCSRIVKKDFTSDDCRNGAK